MRHICRGLVPAELGLCLTWIAALTDEMLLLLQLLPRLCCMDLFKTGLSWHLTMELSWQLHWKQQMTLGLRSRLS